MCDRSIKMKLNEGSILQEVNSNTNSMEFNVKPFNDKTHLSDIIDRINEDIKNITKNDDK